MPWKLDQIMGRGNDDPEIIYAPGTDSRIERRGLHEILPPELLPVQLVLNSKHERLPDFCAKPTTSRLLVSRAFKELVEAWDPVPHHFMPADIKRPNGEIWRDRYFVFEPAGWIKDGLVFEESDLTKRMSKRIPGKFNGYMATSLTPRLMWRGSKIAGRHLWVDADLPDAICVSDELYAELKKQGLYGWQAHESRISQTQP